MTSVVATWADASAATRCPLPGHVEPERRSGCAIVPVGTKTAASIPMSSAARSCSRFTVGSSPYQSSPTSAVAIARRIASEGWVTVSERRSTR